MPSDLGQLGVRFVEEPYVCLNGCNQEDGTDKGFFCPDCRTELITPHKGCDLAGHCTTCAKTFMIDSLPFEDEVLDAVS